MRPPAVDYHPPHASPPNPGDARFRTRSYQQQFCGHFAREEFNRLFKVWHRQGGKDDTDFNAVVQKLVLLDSAGEIGDYVYVFPEFEHGKKALWEKVCGHNIRLIEH